MSDNSDDSSDDDDDNYVSSWQQLKRDLNTSSRSPRLVGAESTQKEPLHTSAFVGGDLVRNGDADRRSPSASSSSALGGWPLGLLAMLPTNVAAPSDRGGGGGGNERSLGGTLDGDFDRDGGGVEEEDVGNEETAMAARAFLASLEAKTARRVSANSRRQRRQQRHLSLIHI